jgi:eukaryotic-like serine/threonine-protein kinase
MMRFTYHCGQEPLPGYSIKRGIGWGGFGEVYFAISAGGKEVALKWIRSNLDVELRGVQQCLNLKHPNLVHLYDVLADGAGRRWLVMEYVAGEPLSTLLTRHPDGVAPELACEWFQGLAAGIHYLHEHGIVHRDLKPANIFLENGLIKVGDYGLCKYIGDSQHAGLTREIGTVHYMAPEISTGNYGRHIDIYAAGIILYEMLTGRVPFEGESAGEILMKHMTSAPDLSRAPHDFRPILAQALDKNPAHRFRSISEMARKVAALGQAPEAPERRPLPCPAPAARRGAEPIPAVLLVAPRLRERWGELTGMLLWAIVFSGLLAAGWALLFGKGEWAPLLNTFYLTLAASWAVLLPSKLWPVTSDDDSWSRRLLLMSLGFGVGLLALWLDGYQFPLPWALGAEQAEVFRPWVPGPNDLVGERSPLRWIYTDNRSMPVLAGYLGFFGLMFLVLRWWKSTEERRRKRFALKPVVAVALWAYLLLFLLPGLPQRRLGFETMVLTAVVCQLVSPWKAPVAVRGKRLRLGYAG